VARLREGKLINALDLAEPMTPALAAAVHALIAGTPSLLALVQADDLAGEILAVNLPGTVQERENWRRRLRGDVASLFENDVGRAIIAAVLAAGRANS
jgi:4-alpha-glucanotransferase